MTDEIICALCKGTEVISVRSLEYGIFTSWCPACARNKSRKPVQVILPLDGSLTVERHDHA